MKDNSREVSSSSTHTTRFTCAYCNNIINRSDTQCPYCGAYMTGYTADVKICPHCGSGETWLITGNECIIKEIEAE